MILLLSRILMRFADFLITERRAGGRSSSHVFTGFRSARPVSARAGRCDASAWGVYGTDLPR
jgi:hypothetical protein